jgi:hypothetical protein
MGKFRRTVVESAILVAGGIYIYRNVLTPETKAKLSSMKDAVSGAVNKIQDMVAASKPADPTAEENEGKPRSGRTAVGKPRILSGSNS